MDCTVVDKHKGVEKCGYLQKQCFKRLLFPYWKRRYFVLCKGKLYSYDSEDYKLNDKNRAVLDLKYFYFIYEAHPDECKKYKESNIFIVSAQDISLFDPTRYMLAADSKEEMLDWMERLKTTVESVKNRKLDLNGSSVNQILVSPSAGDVKHVQTNYTTGSPSFPNKPTVKPEDGLPAMELKPLDNITRTRVKGPSGRRAPRNRHSMQPRSSSLVQLNPIGNGDNQRSTQIVRQSGQNGRKLTNESYPSFAYFYSDEEDSGDEDVNGSDFKSLPYMPLNFNHVISTSQRSSVHFVDDCTPINSKHFTFIKADAILHGDNLNSNNSLGRSIGRVSGRTSPAMDALDDLLMNQSIQQVDLADDVDSDASDSNTFNAHLKPDDCGPAQNSHYSDDNCQDIDDLSSKIKRLQKYITSIETRTASLEENHTIIPDVATELDKIRKDLNNLSSSVKLYSTELTKIKFEFAEGTQKMNLVQRQALLTLSQAEKSKEDYESSKRNYDELICELFNFFSQVKDSIERPPQSTSHEQHPKANETKTEIETKKKRDSVKGTKPRGIPSSSNTESSNKTSAYHSFFQRPTSLLQGLAAKSLFSLGEKDNLKTVKQKKDNKVFVKSNTSKSEKKLFEPTKTPDSKKKKTKSSELKFANSPKTSQNQLLQPETKISKEPLIKLCTDDIPMMDDTVQPDEQFLKQNNHSTTRTAISHVSINVKIPSPKLGVSNSEDLLHKNIPLRKQQIRNSETILNSFQGHSSPTETCTFVYPNTSISSPIVRNNLNGHVSSDKLTVQNCFGRQSSLPETYEYISQQNGSSSRFAIMRQTSSPNLPLKRQSSSGNFPILRQNSLGIVPEEGISRQSSLMSVPEERLIVDQTIPSSLCGSTASFQLAPSSGTLKDFNNLTTRTDSQPELVIASSSDQHLNTGQIPTASEFYVGIDSATTSSLKKKQKVSRLSMQI